MPAKRGAPSDIGRRHRHDDEKPDQHWQPKDGPHRKVAPARNDDQRHLDGQKGVERHMLGHDDGIVEREEVRREGLEMGQHEDQRHKRLLAQGK